MNTLQSLFIAAAVLLWTPAFVACSSKKEETHHQDMADAAKTPAPATAGAAEVPASSPTIATGKVFLLHSVEKASGATRAEFAWLDTDGKTVIKLADFTKGKPVFLNFWGTWCPPCRKELPDIVQLHKELGDKVVFIGIALENERTEQKAAEVVSTFAAKNNLSYINLVGSDKLIAQITGAYGDINAVPTTFIIGKDGKIVDTIQGMSTKAGFMDALKKVL
jgi:thiol-disulfide isomerase/thioredoxin